MFIKIHEQLSDGSLESRIVSTKNITEVSENRTGRTEVYCRYNNGSSTSSYVKESLLDIENMLNNADLVAYGNPLIFQGKEQESTKQITNQR